MAHSARLDLIGAALANSSRSHMLCMLMDGRAFTNKELASAAGITAQTASSHLSQLVEAGLVTALRSGRHVYHRIANEAVATALEHLACLTPIDHLHRHPNAACDLCLARSCYNHLAGRLGVVLTERLLANGSVLSSAEALMAGPNLPAFLDRLGLPPTLAHSAKPVARPCLDWTERRDHIAGPLGTALLTLSRERKWVIRQRQGRALDITPEGQRAFRSHFAIDPTERLDIQDAP